MDNANLSRARSLSLSFQIWRQTTWGGWTVRQLQAAGDYFAPFFIKLSESMSNDKSSVSGILITNCIRLAAIFTAVAMVYVGGYFVQLLIGTEIVVEEEEEEGGGVEEVVDHKPNNNGQTKKERRSAKDKSKVQ